MRSLKLLSEKAHLAGLLCLPQAINACAFPPKDDPEALAAYEAAGDPLEPANRFVFAANMLVDTFLLQPAAVTYRDLTPDELKTPFENLITNLFMPVSFINALLQGDLERADMAAQHFVASVPTLFLADPFPDQPAVFEDAGQTLGVWNVDAGPYLMLPLLGPSNFRDGIGFVIDFFIDPIRYIGATQWSLGRGIGKAVIDRSKNTDAVRDLQRNSLDYYATVRSLYRQRREQEIVNGDVAPLDEPAPTIGVDPEPDQEEKTPPKETTGS
jgi:phospholipid-binding lipoprotein MlaA